MEELDLTYCKFARLGDICVNPTINTQGCKCSRIPIHSCYYKQLKQSNQERDYYKQIVDGCKMEGGSCNFCEIDKQFQDLKKDIKKYIKCIDEIEKICKVHIKWCKDNKKKCNLCSLEPCQDILILQLIKQAKEKQMKIKFKKLNDYAVLPGYQTQGSSGMDVCSVENYVLKPGEIKIFKIGLACEIEQGYEVQVRARSGLSSKHGITVINGVGTIDSDYRGEIGVPLINTQNTDFRIGQGDRIAQLVVCPVIQAEIEVVDELENTTRGEGGFGSTGV